MAGRKDLTIEQGASFRLPVTITTGTDSAPFDLTNWTGTGQIRRTYRAAGDPVATFTVTMSTTPSDGTLEISLSAEDTANIIAGDNITDPASKYVYDIELTHSGTGGGFLDGEIKRLLEGFVYVSPGVTRAP